LLKLGDVISKINIRDVTSAPPPPAGDHEVATSTAPEPSPAVGTVSVESTVDMDFPDIGTIDLDDPELPSND
jgi:hypothetical protein